MSRIGKMNWFGLAALLGTVCGLQAQTPTPQDPEQGLTRQKPVNVCNLEGAEKYMARLQCADGTAVKSKVLGSVGLRQDPADKQEETVMLQQMLQAEPVEPGGKDFHMVYRADLTCGEQLTKLYLDYSHCSDAEPDYAPNGFQLVAAPKEK